MITLDLDLSYLSSHYHISTKSLEKYKNMGIQQIMEIEAAQGNTRAVDFLVEAMSDPEELAKVLQLVNPKNRFLILSHMNKEDLLKVIEMLDTEQLILGMSIFTKDSICELMLKMEPEALTKLVLKNMEPEKFIKMLPEEHLNDFLASDKLDRDILSKAMRGVDEEQLQKMMEKISGQSCYQDKDSILAQLDTLKDDDYKKAVFSMDIEGKQQLIGNVLRDKPELFEEFSPEAMVYPFTQMEKDDVLQAMLVLDPEDFMPMMEELPSEVLSLVATQVNPEDLAQLLSSEFSDILAQCALG